MRGVSVLLASTAATHSGHFALDRIALSRQSRWKTWPHEMMANSCSSGPKLGSVMEEKKKNKRRGGEGRDRKE